MGANDGVHGTGYSRQMTERVSGKQIKRVDCDYPRNCKQRARALLFSLHNTSDP